MNVRGGLKAWLALTLVLFPGAGLEAQQRFALVIGNENYAVGPQLKNPVNDATDVAAELQTLGFEVNVLTNAGLADMRRALQRLGSDLGHSPKSYGFFYFSGRSVQADGANYLVPTDFDAASGSAVRGRALDCQDVLDTVQLSGNQLNVVALDAVGALSMFTRVPEGSLVVLSTAPNPAPEALGGRNGVFAAALIKNLGDESLDVREVVERTSRDVAAQTPGGQAPSVFDQFAGNARLGAPGFVPPAALEGTSKIGTPGPGGGIIFFDKGVFQDGWRYLEAAPEDLPEVPWFNGKDGVVTGADGTAVGTGRENTQTIIAVLGPGTYAASVCAAYDGGGLHDWFLPSKDELAGLFQVLKAAGGLSFSTKFYYYWSSSERNNIETWVQNPGGGQYPNLKGFKHFVRPIREF
jgi:hypothetical protein